MKPIFIFLILTLISSFTFLNPRKAKSNRSPDLDKIMVYIPQTSFEYRESDPMKIGDEFVKKSTVSVKSYYMSPYEVSNFQYLEFLYHLKTSGDTLYESALPDTMVWKHKLALNEPYVQYYLRHPAYRDYPMVGITHKQCEMYCEWLTTQYNKNENRKFKTVKFRLPTKYEWYAACVVDLRNEKAKGKENSKTIAGDYKIFPWEGPWLRNSRGDMLANFIRINESATIRQYDTIIDSEGKETVKMQYVGARNIEQGIDWGDFSFDIVTPVKSYWPNEAGMYCLAGNVEEFVAEYGITKGGSWYDPGYYLRNEVIETYDSTNEATSQRGFRFVMEIIEE